MNAYSRIHRYRMAFLIATNWVTTWFKPNYRHGFQLLLCGATVMTCVARPASTNLTEKTAGTTNRCVQFTLKDQFQKTHEFKFPRDKATVLTVADKKGSDDIVSWAHPLAEKYGDKIIIAGLADVSSVPGPLHSLVQARFRKAIQYPVMLDWEGNATKSFNYTKGSANVYLLSTDGRILQHLTGKADAAELRKLMDLIEREIFPETREDPVPIQID